MSDLSSLYVYVISCIIVFTIIILIPKVFNVQVIKSSSSRRKSLWLSGLHWFFFAAILLLTGFSSDKLSLKPHPSLLITTFYLLISMLTAKFTFFNAAPYQSWLISGKKAVGTCLLLLLVVFSIVDVAGVGISPPMINPQFILYLIAAFICAFVWYKIGLIAWKLDDENQKKVE